MAQIGPWGIPLASAALLGAILLAAVLRLGISRSLITAAARASIQLLLLGWILGWLFREGSLPWIGLALLTMTAVATHASIKRVPFQYRGLALHAFTAIAFGGLGTGLYAASILFPGTSWKAPAVLLPLVGILLGNCLSGISLGLAHWIRELHNNHERVEFWLSHGASRWEAVQLEFREAIRTAMTPVLNSMTVAGIVSLPGMMTGQLLAGADPRSAVHYQIAIMFLVAVGTLLGTILAVFLGFISLFNPRHQFLYDQLVQRVK